MSFQLIKIRQIKLTFNILNYLLNLINTLNCYSFKKVARLRFAVKKKKTLIEFFEEKNRKLNYKRFLYKLKEDREQKTNGKQISYSQVICKANKKVMCTFTMID